MSWTSFISKAKIRRRYNNLVETLEFEANIHRQIMANYNCLKNDKNSNFYIEDKNNSYFIYEIEIDNIEIIASKRLKKTEDFLRRLYYRYDWPQIKIMKNGCVASIENKEEIQTNWKELNLSLQSSYGGHKVEDYLEQINMTFQNDESLIKSFLQYSTFGLLFPGIPISHGSNWQGERQVQLSDLEKDSFTEQISCLKAKNNGQHGYKISGQVLEENETLLEKFDGIITRSAGCLEIDTAKVEIIYRKKEEHIHWNFELEKNELNRF